MPNDQALGALPDDLEEDLQATPPELRHLRFHRLWTDAVGEEGYHKPDWLAAEERLRQANLLP
jgi:hypothetical protein